MKSKTDYSIIADFLSSHIKERIMYELSSPKKIVKAFERLSHNVESVIRSDYIYYKGNILSDIIKSEISKNVTEFTVLSFEYQQGGRMSAEEAFDYLIYECNFAIIASENWLVIKPEYEGGQGLFYVLRKSK